jgi:hypothetical protein
MRTMIQYNSDTKVLIVYNAFGLLLTLPDAEYSVVKEIQRGIDFAKQAFLDCEEEIKNG